MVPDPALILTACTPEHSLEPASRAAHLAQSMPSLLTTRWLRRGGDPLVEAVSAGSTAGSTGSRPCSPKALAPLRESRMGLSKLPEAVRDPKRLPSLQHADLQHEVWRLLHLTWVPDWTSHVLCSSPCSWCCLLCTVSAWCHSACLCSLTSSTLCKACHAPQQPQQTASQDAAQDAKQGRTPVKPSVACALPFAVLHPPPSIGHACSRQL